MTTTVYSSDFGAWSDSNNDVTPEGPILEIPAGVHILSGVSFRDGAATKYKVVAQAGAECTGNVSNPASIATIDFNGTSTYFRKSNITFENLYIKNIDQKVASGDYSNLRFIKCVLSSHMDLSNVCTNGVSFEECVILIEESNIEDSGKKEVVYARGSVPVTLTGCTVLNIGPAPAAGGQGALHTASDSPLTINNTIIYTNNTIPSVGDSGIGGVVGNNNISHDGLAPGAGSITLSDTSIFMNFAIGDYRLKSESLPAIQSTPIGAFIQPFVNVPPTLVSPVSDLSFVFSSSGSSSVFNNFADANTSDVLVFTVTPALPAGLQLSTDGVFTWDGSSSITPSTNHKIRVTDPANSFIESADFAIEVTDLLPAIVSIGVGNVITSGPTFTISTVKLDISPFNQTVLLAGEVLTVTAWVEDLITVLVPLDIDLDWEEFYTLSITDDTRTVTLPNVNLKTRDGWTVVTYDGTVLDEIATESYFEEAKKDIAVGNYTMKAGDKLAYENSTGLTVDEKTYPTVNPPSSVTGGYKIYDVTNSTWTTTSSYTWTDGGAPAEVAPIFAGVLSVPDGFTGQTINIDVSGYWSNSPTLFSTASNLPSGISLSSQGVLSGTYTTAESLSGIVIKGENSAGDDSSNAFTWNVSVVIIPVIRGVLKDWATNALHANATDLKMKIGTAFGDSQVTTEFVFSTDAVGAFEVTNDQIINGTTYYVSIANDAETITELHKITAEAQ